MGLAQNGAAKLLALPRLSYGMSSLRCPRAHTASLGVSPACRCGAAAAPRHPLSGQQERSLHTLTASPAPHAALSLLARHSGGLHCRVAHHSCGGACTGAAADSASCTIITAPLDVARELIAWCPGNPAVLSSRMRRIRWRQGQASHQAGPPKTWGDAPALCGVERAPLLSTPASARLPCYACPGQCASCGNAAARTCAWSRAARARTWRCCCAWPRARIAAGLAAGRPCMPACRSRRTRSCGSTCATCCPRHAACRSCWRDCRACGPAVLPALQAVLAQEQWDADKVHRRAPSASEVLYNFAGCLQQAAACSAHNWLCLCTAHVDLHLQRPRSHGRTCSPSCCSYGSGWTCSSSCLGCTSLGCTSLPVPV